MRVASASSRPRKAFKWMLEIEKVGSWQALEMDPQFEQMEFKIADAAHYILPTEIKRRIEVLNERMMRQYERVLLGRQILWILYDSMRCAGPDEQVAEILDLVNVRLHGDNLEEFIGNWSMCLSQQTDPPSDAHLECLFRRQIEESAQFKMQLNWYNQRAKILNIVSYTQASIMIKI